MPPFSEWFPPLAVGVVFTLLGSIKLYGLARGMVGGRGTPFVQHLCGT